VLPGGEQCDDVEGDIMAEHDREDNGSTPEELKRALGYFRGYELGRTTLWMPVGELAGRVHALRQARALGKRNVPVHLAGYGDQDLDVDFLAGFVSGALALIEGRELVEKQLPMGTPPAQAVATELDDLRAFRKQLEKTAEKLLAGANK
jgi:hypothetical protein